MTKGLSSPILKAREYVHYITLKFVFLCSMLRETRTAPADIEPGCRIQQRQPLIK